MASRLGSADAWQRAATERWLLIRGEPRPSAVPLVPHPRVAIVSDDLASLTPWTPHGIEVRGTAVLQDEGGGPAPSDQLWARIAPERIVSWGID